MSWERIRCLYAIKNINLRQWVRVFFPEPSTGWQVTAADLRRPGDTCEISKTWQFCPGIGLFGSHSNSCEFSIWKCRARAPPQTLIANVLACQIGIRCRDHWNMGEEIACEHPVGTETYTDILTTLRISCARRVVCQRIDLLQLALDISHCQSEIPYFRS